MRTVIALTAALLLAGCAQSAPQPPPLPPGTGLDGEASIATPVTTPQATPDGGAGVSISPTATPTTDGHDHDGVGGVAIVSSPTWKGKRQLNAGFYYPSGGFHGGWDVGLTIGHKLFAARDGYVVARSGAPVPNHLPGPRPLRPGMPSNWVLICSRIGDRWASLYYQHLSPGVQVRTGQKVHGPRYDYQGRILKRGTLLGRSGDSGFSTGPHLHQSAQWSTRGGSRRCDPGERYAYFQDQWRLFAPSLFWLQDPEWLKPPARPVLPERKVRRDQMRAGRHPWVRVLRHALGDRGLKVGQPGGRWDKPLARGVQKFKVRHELRNNTWPSIKAYRKALGD